MGGGSLAWPLEPRVVPSLSCLPPWPDWGESPFWNSGGWRAGKWLPHLRAAMKGHPPCVCVIPTVPCSCPAICACYTRETRLGYDFLPSQGCGAQMGRRASIQAGGSGGSGCLLALSWDMDLLFTVSDFSSLLPFLSSSLTLFLPSLLTYSIPFSFPPFLPPFLLPLPLFSPFFYFPSLSPPSYFPGHTQLYSGLTLGSSLRGYFSQTLWDVRYGAWV